MSRSARGQKGLEVPFLSENVDLAVDVLRRVDDVPRAVDNSLVATNASGWSRGNVPGWGEPMAAAAGSFCRSAHP